MSSMIVGYESALAAAEVGFRAVFNEGLESGEARYNALIDALSGAPIRDDVEIVNHVLSGPLPAMVEWVGDRKIAGLEASTFQIINKRWAIGIEVREQDVRRNTLGKVEGRIRDLGKSVAKKKFGLLRTLLNAVKTTSCYDGVYFAATNHPVGSSTASNLTTDLFDADALAAAIARMKNLTDDAGDPLDVMPTHLFVGPELEFSALEVLKRSKDDYGADNVLQGYLDLVVIPGMTTNTWAVISAADSARPFILQVPQDGQFRALNTPEASAAFHRGVYLYGTDFEGNAGAGLWQLMQYSDASGS